MKSSKRHQTFARHSLSIPAKANKVLNIILVAFILIILRLWQLTVVQHDEYEERSKRPQRRTFIESAKRGTIRDRYNLPLAINKIQYNAAIIYSPIRQIPAVRWHVDEKGNKTKKFKRREYINKLSQLLANKLSLDPERVEDLIHSKGAIYNQTPFVIKEDISEKEYYSLKILERQWPGIATQRIPKRFYPYERTAGDLIGYIGAINRGEYEKIIQEIAFLEEELRTIELDETYPFPEGFESSQQIRQRLLDLQEKSYTINDSVGKSGIESRYERDLRGFSGKKSFYSDAKGNFLKEFPGSRDPLSGRRILLSLSIELQEYAEKLLIQNERIRQTRVTVMDETRRKFMAQQTPWIKGGAILAMNPHNGEILAMASYPRCDPNDFISGGNNDILKQKRSNIFKWFETETHIAELWDQQKALEREKCPDTAQEVITEDKMIDWKNYIEFILPKENAIFNVIGEKFTINDGACIGKCMEKLSFVANESDGYKLMNSLYTGGIHIAHTKGKLQQDKLENVEALIEKSTLDSYFQEISENYDKVLLVDLCGVAVDHSCFDDDLLKAVGKTPLSTYRDLSAAMSQLRTLVYSMAKELYKDFHFKQWRKDNEKEFLKEKRAEEKALKRYAKPYIDLLDSKEKSLFEEFWQTYRWEIFRCFLCGKSAHSVPDELISYIDHFNDWKKEISQGAHQQLPWIKNYKKLQKFLVGLPSQQQTAFMKSLRSYSELTRPLFGKYPSLRDENSIQKEKHLAAAFYPKHGFGYGRSNAYRQSTTQGSLFKLVTAHEAMLQKLEKDKHLAHGKLLEITDHFYTIGKDSYVGTTADGHPIPRFYKGGRIPRSVSANFGKMDIIKAIETSSNPYFALLAGDHLASPGDLARAAKDFSFGARTGIDLPAELAGKIPQDLETNRTGLYAMAIGQHTLVVTPLQTAVMLSAIANGGKILTPRIGTLSLGCKPSRDQGAISCLATHKYQDPLSLVGIDFPLFLAVDKVNNKAEVEKFPVFVKNFISMPTAVRKILLEGMYRVVLKSHKESLSSLSRLYSNHPEAISDYIDLKREIFGKTSTSEVIERINLDKNKGTYIYNHIWFGGISFNSDIPGQQEVFVSKDSYGVPELVVVVYLRFGGFGKESAPIAAQIVSKWREIKASHAK